MANDSNDYFMGSFMRPFKGRGQDNRTKTGYATFNSPSNIVPIASRQSPRFQPRNEAILKRQFDSPLYKTFAIPKQSKWGEVFKGVNLGNEPSISNRLGQIPQFLRRRV